MQEKLRTHTRGLQVQGSILALVTQKKEDLLWKSVMFQLKSGTLKFMLNARIDTLPTPANLRYGSTPHQTSASCVEIEALQITT